MEYLILTLLIIIFAIALQLYFQLKKSKSFIVTKDKILFNKPTLFSKPVAKIQKGRLLIYNNCKKNWCNVETADYNGWISTDNTWGKVR